MIDLRSDTVTKPSDKMRAAMASAEVGDDVYGDDPTINRLQEHAAEIFEKESALWMPTGCMANEVAVKVHTKPGQEIIIEERGHIHEHELAAAAVFSGRSCPFGAQRRRFGASDMGRDRTGFAYQPGVLGFDDRPYLSRKYSQLRRRQHYDRRSLHRHLQQCPRRRIARPHGRRSNFQCVSCIKNIGRRSYSRM
jgi:Threonine aldolase